jgi:hypothetical protein
VKSFKVPSCRALSDKNFHAHSKFITCLFQCTAFVVGTDSKRCILLGLGSPQTWGMSVYYATTFLSNGDLLYHYRVF